MTSPAPAVLVVTYDGLLEPLGASQVVPYVTGLVGEGFEIEVLSFEKPADLARPPAVEGLRARLGETGVRWQARAYHARPTLPATLLDVIVGRRHVARWAARGGRLVHARGYVAGLMGLAAGRRGARLLFDMRGFWVDERIEAGYWTPGGPPARIGRWIEREVLSAADHLTLQTAAGLERVAALSPGSPPPGTLIRPCTDLERFTVPLDPREARRALGLPDRPTLVHAGNLTGWYDGALTVQVGRAFVERTGGSFVVLTREPDEARRLTRAHGVEAVIATAEPADVPRWLQAADAGLALVRDTPAKHASFPVKLGEYLATGLAALVTPIGDLPELEDGLVLKALRAGQGPAEAAGWLGEAVRRPDRQARARALAERHLSLEEGVRRLAQIYRRLGVSPS